MKESKSLAGFEPTAVRGSDLKSTTSLSLFELIKALQSIMYCNKVFIPLKNSGKSRSLDCNQTKIKKWKLHTRFYWICSREKMKCATSLTPLSTSWSDCTDMQAGLALYWWQMLITFSSSRLRVKLLAKNLSIVRV